MARPRGSPKTPGSGRKPGSQNKLTKDVREAFEEAVEIAQGKEGYSLADWATRSKEDNAKFWQAALKAMPKKLELSGAVTLEAIVAASRRPRD